MTLRYTTAATSETVLSTQLDLLASATNSTVSGEISNDAAGEFDAYAMCRISIAQQNATRVAGATLAVYVIPKLDAYPDVIDECMDNYLAGAVYVDDATLAARSFVLAEIRLPPSDFKIAIKNLSGQAFGTAGNTVTLSRWTYRDV
jgi:hypothetical protein